MKKPKLYLETSAWNFCFADDAPEKQAITLQFFENINEYDIFISEVVLTEIARASGDKRELLFNLIQDYHLVELKTDEEVLNLAQKYLDEGALPQKAENDSLHAAVATVNELDALISWNLKHLANLKRMEKLTGLILKKVISRSCF